MHLHHSRHFLHYLYPQKTSPSGSALWRGAVWAHCLFKAPRLVCFVLINPPFSNTHSGGSWAPAAPATREPPLYLERKPGNGAVMAANMYRVGGKADSHTHTQVSSRSRCLLHGGHAVIRRRSFLFLSPPFFFLFLYRRNVCTKHGPFHPFNISHYRSSWALCFTHDDGGEEEDGDEERLADYKTAAAFFCALPCVNLSPPPVTTPI